MGILKQNIHK